MAKSSGEQAMKLTNVKIIETMLKSLIDTGSVQTLVQRQFIPADVICTSDTKPIYCVHRDERLCPTADILKCKANPIF